MKRLLVLNYEFPPLGGGAANATYYLLKEFAKDAGLQIDLVTSSVDTFRTEKFADNITIHYLDIGKNGNLHYQSNKDLLTYSYKAYRYAKKLIHEGAQYDVCHAFFGIPSGFVAMVLGVPYIVSLRGSDVPFYNARFKLLDTLVFKRLSKKIWRNARAVVANSQSLKDLAQQSAPEQDISVIYNGVDATYFAPADTKHAQQNLTLISTGRLIERKGYRYLIEALAGLENVHLTLVGDGNVRHELEQLAQDKKVAVTFRGKQDKEQVRNLLQQADLFVLPSLNEGMSNSVLEAMACGLPVIVTDTGGSGELVRNNNGIVVPKADAEALRSAVARFARERGTLIAMGQASRARAIEMAWANMAQEYQTLYELA